MSTATLSTRNCEADVRKALEASPYPDLRRLIIEETEDELIIRGLVTTYYLKQQAQELIKLAVVGKALVNRVIVKQQVEVTRN